MGEAKRRQEAGTQHAGIPDALHCAIAITPDACDEEPEEITAVVYTNVPYPAGDDWRRPLSELLGHYEKRIVPAYRDSHRRLVAKHGPGEPGILYCGTGPEDASPLVGLCAAELYEWSKRHVTVAIKHDPKRDRLRIAVTRGARLARSGPTLDVSTANQWAGDKRRYIDECGVESVRERDRWQ